jgi:primosomal protein N'
VPAQNGTGAYSVPAEMMSQAGHSFARLRADGDMAGKAVDTITTFGKEDPTLVEVKRAKKLLEALQGKITDFGPWNHKISFGENVKWPAEWSQSPTLPIKLKPDTIPRPLNTSQQKAVCCMLDETDSTRLTIIQGPPGTGKTTVIASYVLRALSGGRSGIWLIAQSNEAVKNIAEKLADFGLSNWRLLVSEDFYA